MKIECPSCLKENNLNLEAKVNCGHCKKEISGYTYKKPLLSATTALMIGAGGFYATDKLVLSDDRYPIEIEYALIDTCVNAFDRAVSYRNYEKQQEICVCALETTISSISYKDYMENEPAFLSKLAKNKAPCG